MTITHNIARGQERTITTTEYDPDTNDLTRIITSKIHTINMKDKTTLSDLQRLTELDNESFELMAYLQRSKKCSTK